jgi:multiple sugar transport system substrate-binding protein
MADHKFSRRSFIKAAGLTTLSSVLAACAPTVAPTTDPAAAAAAPEKPTQQPAAKTGGEVVITVGAWALDSTKELADKLNFKDTGYTLNVQVRPGGPELTSALTAGMASGKSPYDVIDFEDEVAITYSRSGFFLTLDDLLDPGFWDDFPKIDLDTAKVWNQYEGKTFRIHHNYEAQYSWYRKDWFDAKGLQPPTTWDEVAALGKAFTDEGKSVWGVEEGMTTGAMAVYLGYMTLQSGGNPFDADDKFKTTLEYINKLMNDDKALNPACLQKGYDQQNADFTSDKVAYMRQWPFFYDVARAKADWFKDEKAVICLPPTGPGGKANSTYAAGWGYGILKTAPNMEGAKTLLKFLVDKKNAGQMALMNTWYLINRKSVLDTVGDKGMAKYLKMYSDAGVIGTRPFHPKFVEASTKLEEAASAYLTKQINIDQAMKQAQDSMKALSA